MLRQQHDRENEERTDIGLLQLHAYLLEIYYFDKYTRMLCALTAYFIFKLNGGDVIHAGIQNGQFAFF